MIYINNLMGKFSSWLSIRENNMFGYQNANAPVPHGTDFGGLGVRARKLVNRMGVQTLKDLTYLSADTIMHSPFARHDLVEMEEIIQQIRQVLLRQGLYLDGESPTVN